MSKLESYKVYCIYIGSSGLSSAGVLISITSNIWRASVNHSSSARTIVIDVNKEDNSIKFFGDITGIKSLKINTIDIIY